jgi:hypothetical protein
MSSTKVCSNCKENKDISLYKKKNNQCKECLKKKRKCSHNITKAQCRLCNPSRYCEHNKRKEQCKKCGGSAYCKHGTIKYYCKPCGGSSFCEHGIIKYTCKPCGGGYYCEHGVKHTCETCGREGYYCEHDLRKDQCKKCEGNAFCEHKKIKYYCITCNPDCACKECKSVLVNKNSTFHPLCQACFCNAYPDHEKSTLYKIKERYLRDELRVRFPDKDIDMIFDKAVDGGCSKKRPDVLIDLLLYSIIIECDENQHKNYECENKRTMQLFEDLANRPLILIRFNPDNYIENNKKVEGCFKPLTKEEDYYKKRFYDLNEEEWKRRVDVLEKVIIDKIRDDIPEKEFEEIKLFYDI